MATTYTSILFSKAPKYLLEKRNQIIMVLFVSIFAIVFIYVFKPFESRQWITARGFSETMYLVWSSILVLLGMMAATGMIYGSLKAIQQKDLRKMLAYSSIAQIGYIGIGMAVGNVYGLIGAVLHIINHSFMKGGLFFCAGAIQYKYGVTGLDNLGQLYRKMPKTVIVMVLAALSMVGIPPTAGFFSKWYLALGAVQAGDYIYVAVLVVSSLLNAVYFFRMLEHIFMDQTDEKVEVLHETKGEVSWMHLIPIILCGIGILALGFANTWFVSLLTGVIEGVAA